MWDDDNNSVVMQNFFAEPPQIMARMPKIINNEEPATNELEPEMEAAIDAIEKQPVIVADEKNNIDGDEQRRHS